MIHCALPHSGITSYSTFMTLHGIIVDYITVTPYQIIFCPITMHCTTVLYYISLHYILPCTIMLQYTSRYYTVLYCIMSYCPLYTLIYCTILNHIEPDCGVEYSTVLYFVIYRLYPLEDGFWGSFANTRVVCVVRKGGRRLLESDWKDCHSTLYMQAMW